ncbi:MAG: diacylglycerol kinase family lipid kinase [Chloroflexi bacterium]|nr:diacylglycerol kinase family lipid kinase [Chloroflexota bacterium]
MTRRVKLILNPMADMGHAWNAARDLRPIVKEFDGKVDWSGTVYPGHGIELAKQAGEDGYDLVVALGGDGTVHEVVNGLMQVEAKKRPALGVVPIGSGNDFAYANNIPESANQAMALALKGDASPIDLGLMTDENGRQEYLDNTLGIGFDTVVGIRSHRLPLLRGFLMYLVAVFQTIIFNSDPMHMKIESEEKTWEKEIFLLVIANGPREGGGFMMAPSARPDDGVLNYMLADKVSRLMQLRLLPEFMKGTQERFKEVEMGEFKKLSLTSDKPLYVHLDGETYTSFGSNLRGLSVEILPNALNVVRPAKK